MNHNLKHIALLLILFPALMFGATVGDSVVVAISPFPPMVIDDNGSYSGFDIDLWEAIAEEMEISYSYIIVPFDSIFQQLTSQKADLAIAGISINAHRERIFDFSQHYFDSGLRIMVLPGRTSFLSRFSGFFTPGIIRGVLVLTLFILLCGHVLWWVERGKDAINDQYFPGILEAFWCVVTTMTTVGYGDIAPRKWLGRLAAFLVMVTGIGLFGWIIGEFAAVTTVQRLESSINSPADLRSKRVATVRGTTSVDALRDVGAIIVTTSGQAEAYEKLLNREVDAVVYDAPNLLYYANHEGSGRVMLTGDMFDQQYYGIAFPEGSPLREEVNRALLKLREKKYGVSVYDRLYLKWFGG